MKKMLTNRPTWVLLMFAFLGLSLQTYADVEPNDDFATATPLALNTLQHGDLFIDPVNDLDDYYMVTLPANGLVSVTGSFNSELSGYIYIYSSSGAQLSYSAAGSGEKSVSVDCIASGIVYIRVGRNSGSGNYSFTVTLDQPANSVDAEPNNSISTIQATYLENQTWTGQLGYSGAQGVDGDDYFYIISPRDGDVVLSATFDDGLNGWIYLYNKNGSLIGYTQLLGESGSYTAMCQAADTLIARITRSSGCGSYTASFTTLGLDNANDVEPNGSIVLIKETFEESVEWTGHLGHYDSDIGIDSDDYFYIISPRDGDVVLSATFDDGLNGWIYLYNKNGAQIGYTQLLGGSGSYPAMRQAADTLIARITRSSGCGSYTASFSTTVLDFENDVEPNNAIATAIPSLNSTINEGHLGHYSTGSGTDSHDYYQIYVAQVPFELEAKLVKSDDFSGYVYLYGSSGNQILYVPHSGELEVALTYTITVAGEYYIDVQRSNGCGSYSLGNFCANAPEVAISPNGPLDICPGESVLLTATSGLTSYSWLRNGIEVSTSQIYLATEPGTYEVVGYDANGCDGISEEVIIGVFDVPQVSVSTTDPTSFCTGFATITATSGFDSYLWSNGETGQSIDVGESGTYSVTATTADGCNSVSSNEIEITLLPDSDGDGICDEDDSCPFLAGEIGDACDDGDASTENDLITEDCECVGTPIISYDCPDLEANHGDGCDDGDSTTENDVITADCECVGTPIVSYDCPALSANVGDDCDDGNPDSENDMVTADCECVGTIVYDCPDLEANVGDACDDGDANTENDMVTADCECVGTVVYDCPALEANVGDACDDGDASTENDMVTADCECAGTVIVVVEGCMDPLSCNYNPAATLDDGSCECGPWYLPANYPSNDLPAVRSCDGAPDGYELAENQDCAESTMADDSWCSSISFDGFCAEAYNDCAGIYDCPDLSANVGDDCDDGNPDSENDMVTADCECVGTIVYDCPDLEANVGDACDDGDASTENDMVTADCECAGTVIVVVEGCMDPLSCNYNPAATLEDGSCEYGPWYLPANYPSNDLPAVRSCDGAPDGYELAENQDCAESTMADDSWCSSISFDGFCAEAYNVGAGIYDCPDLEANVGDACDDGDANTENDMVTADCECVGTIVYDCPDLEANVGDGCDDGDANTENDMVTVDCECAGSPVVPGDCTNFVYYLSDNNAGEGSRIYAITLSGGTASLDFIAQHTDEIHIAYNANNNLIY